MKRRWQGVKLKPPKVRHLHWLSATNLLGVDQHVENDRHPVRPAGPLLTDDAPRSEVADLLSFRSVLLADFAPYSLDQVLAELQRPPSAVPGTSLVSTGIGAAMQEQSAVVIAAYEDAADARQLLWLDRQSPSHISPLAAPIGPTADSTLATRSGLIGWRACRADDHDCDRIVGLGRHAICATTLMLSTAAGSRLASMLAQDYQVEPHLAHRDPGDSLRTAVSGALVRWRMLAKVRRLGVGLSGGADSLALLDALSELDLPVELVPLHVHQHPRHQEPQTLANYVEERHGLDLRVISADTSRQARRSIAAGKAPCRVCAPLRARRIGDAARQLRLDAVALGHHLDDAAATLVMNIFHTGSVDTMRPVARRRQHPGIPILRPMLLVSECDVKAASPTAADGLFDCGMCSVHAAERARVSAFVAEMFGIHPPAIDRLASLVASLADDATLASSSSGRGRRS